MGWLVAGLTVAAIVVLMLVRLPWSTTDSLIMSEGTRNQLRCLADGHFTGCRDHFAHKLVAMDWFPPAQHLPDAALQAMRLESAGARVRGLGVVSLLSVIAAAALGAGLLRRSGLRASSYLFLLAVVAGPMVPYAHSAFGEAFSAFLLVAFVVSTQRPDRAGLIGITALLAALTKETAPTIVFAVGVLGLDIARVRRPQPVRAAALALTAGALGGLATNLLYNVFRFGTARNPVYALFLEVGPSLGQAARFLAGLLVSPNAGIAWYWPVAAGLLLLAAAAPFTGARRRPPPGEPPPGTPAPPRPATGGWHREVLGADRARWHALAVLAVFLGVNAVLAMWWMPYGWMAWGPRLTVPWVPPLLVLALLAGGENLEALVHRALRTPARAVAWGIAAGLSALPHLAAALDLDFVRGFLAGVRDPFRYADYYPNLDRLAFTRFPMLLSAMRTLASPWRLALGAGLVVTCVMLADAAARAARSTAGPPPAGDLEPPAGTADADTDNDNDAAARRPIDPLLTGP